jgi:hypothetical protein
MVTKKVSISTPKPRTSHHPVNEDRWVGVNSRKRITIDCPEEMHSKFNKAVTNNDKTMTEVILAFVADYIKRSG